MAHLVAGNRGTRLEEILDELKPIIVEVLCVDPSEVVPTARFIEDLGMD